MKRAKTKKEKDPVKLTCALCGKEFEVYRLLKYYPYKREGRFGVMKYYCGSKCHDNTNSMDIYRR